MISSFNFLRALSASCLTRPVEQSKFLAEREMAKKDSSYTVIFEPLEGGGYQVIVPALPEIISAGHTLQEARRMARDAIRCALEGMSKENVTFPKDINREPRTEKLRVSFKAA